MRIGIVGCGYISARYLRTIQLRPALKIVGVTDVIRERRELLAKHADCAAFDSLDHLLNESGADIILNLTNPHAHYEVNKAAILAGKHVYCEKPLATALSQAQEVVALAKEKGVQLSGAPCNVLSETAQAVWRELRRKSFGTLRLAYAEMDDGMVPQSPYEKWVNEFGIPWPAKDEFEVGCTLEHAGYYLTWLAAFFGPAESISRFGATTIPDKWPTPLERHSPDFTIAGIHFHSGITARLTCSIVAEQNRSLRIMGDHGVLTVKDCWDFRSYVGIQKRLNLRRKSILTPWSFPVSLPPPPLGKKVTKKGSAPIDFASGVSELADAVRRNRPSRLSPDYCLHITELSLAINDGEHNPGRYVMKTTFEPIEPMPWSW